MPKELKVKIIDIQSQETLFECSVDEMESAYQQAAIYEEMGLDVKIIAPSITQTLTNTLGLTHDEEEEYQNSVVAEMEDHDGSCCAEPSQIHAGEPDKIQ
tara:strand:- start:494 stop:793 length:300 start_codon:yes stop_codon:yes gene_type:complete